MADINPKNFNDGGTPDGSEVIPAYKTGWKKFSFTTLKNWLDTFFITGTEHSNIDHTGIPGVASGIDEAAHASINHSTVTGVPSIGTGANQAAAGNHGIAGHHGDRYFYRPINDGVTDESAALQTLADSIYTAGGGDICVASGRIVLSRLVLPESVNLYGVGYVEGHNVLLAPKGAQVIVKQQADTYTTGSITANSGALTVTGATFTADDIGKCVTVAGASPQGDLYTSIGSIVDTDTVTLNQYAARTVTGATVHIGFAPIEIARANKIGNFSIYYPDQANRTTPLVYPPAIKTTHGSADCLIDRVKLVNPYIGIDIGESHARISVNDVFGSPLKVGIINNESWDVDKITNVHFSAHNAFWAEGEYAGLLQWRADNGIAFLVRSVDSPMYANCFAWGYQYTWRFEDGSRNTTGNYSAINAGQFSNCSADGSKYGFSVKTTKDCTLEWSGPSWITTSCHPVWADLNNSQYAWEAGNVNYGVEIDCPVTSSIIMGGVELWALSNGVKVDNCGVFSLSGNLLLRDDVAGVTTATALQINGGLAVNGSNLSTIGRIDTVIGVDIVSTTTVVTLTAPTFQDVDTPVKSTVSGAKLTLLEPTYISCGNNDLQHLTIPTSHSVATGMGSTYIHGIGGQIRMLGSQNYPFISSGSATLDNTGFFSATHTHLQRAGLGTAIVSYSPLVTLAEDSTTLVAAEYNMRFQGSSGKTVTDAIGNRVSLDAQNSFLGTITNFIGNQVKQLTSKFGVWGTVYGFLCEELNFGSANWAFYSKGSTPSKFEGKVSVGSFQVGTSATPGHVLTADASGNATFQASTGGGGLAFNQVATNGTTITGRNLLLEYAASAPGTTTINTTSPQNGDRLVIANPTSHIMTIVWTTTSNAPTTVQPGEFIEVRYSPWIPRYEFHDRGFLNPDNSFDLRDSTGAKVGKWDAANKRISNGTTSPLYPFDWRQTGLLTIGHWSTSGNDDGGYQVVSGAFTHFVTGGAIHNGTNWVAKATTAVIFGSAGTGFTLYADSGLTAGNTYTPTLRANFPTDGGMKLATGTRPTADAAHRGTVFYVAGGAGVADTLEICRKDAADNYAWVALF